MTDPSTAEMIGPPVTFDPELAAALAMVRDFVPKFESLASIPAGREMVMAGFTTSALDQRVSTGLLKVLTRTVPGAVGDPDFELFIVQPAAVTSPTPALYYTHGGGMMILGNAQGISEEYLDWVERFGCAIVSMEYGSHPKPRTLARWRTATNASMYPSRNASWA